jgi:predicted HNH restriction endonuclease
MEISRLRRMYKALRPAHEAAIRFAAISPRRPNTAKTHSPGLVAFIMREVGARPVQPAYIGSHFDSNSTIAEEIPVDDDFEEGTAIKVLVNRYERDPAARERCINHYGTKCAACGMSLADRYGPQALGLIHVHHLTPLASQGKRRVVNPIRDLRPVYPNCHAVIHAANPPRSVAEVKRMVRERFASVRGADRSRS